MMLRKGLSKFLLFLGASLVLSAVAGSSSVVYPQYFVFYWLAAAGLSLLIAGLLELALA